MAAVAGGGDDELLKGIAKITGWYYGQNSRNVSGSLGGCVSNAINDQALLKFFLPINANRMLSVM